MCTKDKKQLNQPCHTLFIQLTDYHYFSYWNSQILIKKQKNEFEQTYYTRDLFPEFGQAMKQKREISKDTKVVQLKFDYSLVYHYTIKKFIEGFNQMKSLQTLKLLMKQNNQIQKNNWTQDMNKRINLIIQEWQ